MTDLGAALARMQAALAAAGDASFREMGPRVSAEAQDCLRILFVNGPTRDRDLPSTAARDELVRPWEWVRQHADWNFLTAFGIAAAIAYRGADAKDIITALRRGEAGRYMAEQLDKRLDQV